MFQVAAASPAQAIDETQQNWTQSQAGTKLTVLKPLEEPCIWAQAGYTGL